MTSALTVGLPIQLQLVAYGGTPPYTYAIASGLPAGLSLNAATGLVTGTPTTVQSSTALEWSVTDSATPTPATATDTFLVVVQAVPVAVPFYSFPVASAGRWRLRGAFEVIGPESVTVGFALGGIGIGASIEVPPSVATVGLSLGGIGIGASVEAVQPPSATVGLSLSGIGIGAAMASTVSATVGLSLGGVGIGAAIQNGVDLTANLLAWYKLDEASGNALDAHSGGYNLTQAGTVGSVAGKVGNARSFPGNNDNRLSSTNAIFNFGNTNRYIAGWVRFSGSASAEKTVLSRWNFDSDNRGYVLLRNTAGELRWFVSANGTTNTNVGISSIAVDTTYFVEVFHDATNDLIGIAVNRGTFTTAAHSTGIFNSSAAFILGSFGNSVFASPMDGWEDELAIYSALPTEGLRDALWNSGNGVTYP